MRPAKFRGNAVGAVLASSLTAMAAAGLFAGPVEAAAMPSQAYINQPAAQLPIEDAQFFWGGNNYCFYPNGWHGPGFYYCGYAWRRGYGWGGPAGWHGWHGGRGGFRGGPHGGFHGGPHGGFHGGPHGGFHGGPRGGDGHR